MGSWLVAAHLAWWVLLVVLRRAGRLKASVPSLAIALCLPFVGEAMVCAASLTKLRPEERERLNELDVDRTGTSFAPALPDEGTNEADLVPLEDALLSDDASLRRNTMLSALLSSPERYVSVIAQARGSADTEVSHYASAAMTEFSKTYEDRIAKLERRLADDPNDTEVLASFISVLEDYLGSGLLQGHMLHTYQALYTDLLVQKHVRAETLGDDLKLVDHLLNEGWYEDADQLLSRMEGAWPESQEVWCVRLRYLVAVHDAAGVDAAVESMRRAEGYKTPQVRDALEYWGKA